MTPDLPPENSRIVVQWPGRPEDAAANARRTIQMIENFEKCDPRLGLWRESGLTQREASVPFSTLPPQLGPMIRRFDAARCRAANGEPLAALAFLLDVRNTAFEWPLELSASVGNPSGPNTALPNRIDLVVPQTTDDTPDGPSGFSLKPALLALIDAWAPTVGRIDPPGLAALRTGRPRVEAGWITYLAPTLARLVSPPAEAAVEPAPGGGLLLSVGDHPFDPANRTALALWRSIQDSLAVLDKAWPTADAATPNPESDR